MMICFRTVPSATKWLFALRQGLAVLLLCSAGIAYAADLDTAKSQGWVGERADGYVGLVRNDASADIVAMVKSVNTRRRAEYQRIAAQNQLDLSQVEALAGRKTIDKTPAGGWIKSGANWQQK